MDRFFPCCEIDASGKMVLPCLEGRGSTSHGRNDGIWTTLSIDGLAWDEKKERIKNDNDKMV